VKPRTRRLARTAALVVLGGGVLLFLALLFWFRAALYNRFVLFPRQQVAWEKLRGLREEVTEDAGWKEFRGILHSHSELSPDSEVPFEEILRVLKAADLDFICLSDHCDQGRANFDAQWRGFHDGKLFIPGFEMREGFMPFGVKSGVVLSNASPNELLARQIVENGGVLFYAHCEERRAWDRPELTGMEIYNIHVDFKRFKGGFRGLLPDVILSLGSYPDHLYYRVFQRPTEFLQRWDQLNASRNITGIAGNDCHQNVGFRGFYTERGTLRIEDTSPETLVEKQLNWLTRPLARLAFGSLTPGRKLFHVQLDPYERSARFVNTHILAQDLTESSLLDALRVGRVFIGFNVIADSRGFRWFALSGGQRAVMGESQVLSSDTRLRAVSPLPCRFTVLRDGTAVHQQEGRSLEWKPTVPGKYRVEAELSVRGKWVPWVYANPISLVPPA
jgi:hypothetical protein